MQRTRSGAPARYVAGLLLWQGIGWLILAGTGLGLWIASLPGILNVYADGAAVLWTWLELLAIAVGLSIGAAEIGMSCRLRGGPKAVATVATGLHGLTLAGVLVVAAVLVMLAGSVLELLALNGTFLSHCLSACRPASGPPQRASRPRSPHPAGPPGPPPAGPPGPHPAGQQSVRAGQQAAPVRGAQIRQVRAAGPGSRRRSRRSGVRYAPYITFGPSTRPHCSVTGATNRAYRREKRPFTDCRGDAAAEWRDVRFMMRVGAGWRLHDWVSGQAGCWAAGFAPTRKRRDGRARWNSRVTRTRLSADQRYRGARAGR